MAIPALRRNILGLSSQSRRRQISVPPEHGAGVICQQRPHLDQRPGAARRFESTDQDGAAYESPHIKKREKIIGEQAADLAKDENLETLSLWAIDLIRLVGNFGSNLVQHPASIYKLIPPFCPKNSMLGRPSDPNTLSVLGASVADWDDCHARLSVGTEESGRRVIATAEVFAALVPGAQCLVIWHAETCEELRRLHHGEYVTEVAVNKKGNMVCTTGRQTIKVWELGTGVERGSLMKHSDDRILAVGFGIEDDQILVGYQDHLIVCQNWRTREIIYRFSAVLNDDTNSHNGLRVVSFSPDGTKLVVGSRNRPVDLWNLTTQSRAARCVMRDEVYNADDDVYLQPEVIQWHPNSGNIYILYHNTTLIDWNPVLDEKIERKVLGAKGIVCSPCGNYLFTFDAGGSIRVLELRDPSSLQLPELRTIYHLEYQEQLRDVAFSPDAHRFYDLRGPICSVWEPEALVPADRPDKDDDQGSNWDSNSSCAPVTQKARASSSLAPVTAIACAPNDIGFCSGHDDGTISVHEMETGSKVKSLGGHAPDMAIIGLAWSSTGAWIASADDSGRVLVRKVRMLAGPGQKMRVGKTCEFRVSIDGINQLLFSSDDRYLLVSTLSGDKIWDLEAKKFRQEKELPFTAPYQWTEHPSDPSRLVSIEAGEVHIFCWNDFVELTPGDGLRFVRTDDGSITGKRKIAHPIAATGDNNATGGDCTPEQYEITSIIKPNGNRPIILETLPRAGYDRDRFKRRRIEFIPTTDLSPHIKSGELVLNLSDPELTRVVRKLVGSYMNRLVFFNVQHWLCTWEVGTPVETCKPHFFLPDDWVSSEILQLNALSDQGTLLCPRRGEVAIIKNGFRF